MPSNRKSRKSSSHNHISYKIYYSRLLKDIHSGHVMMSQKFVSIMDSMMHDMFEKIVTQSVHLMKVSNRKVLTERDIQFAVSMIFPGQLGEVGVRKGAEAVNRLKNGKDDKGLPPNSLESKNSSMYSDASQQKSSDLLYDTFRSNVRGHSSPLRPIARDQTRSGISNSSSNSNRAGNEEHEPDGVPIANVRRSESHEEENGDDRPHNGEGEGDNMRMEIEENVRNLPPMQRGPISALIGCIPHFLMFRRNRNT